MASKSRSTQRQGGVLQGSPAGETALMAWAGPAQLTGQQDQGWTGEVTRDGWRLQPQVKQVRLQSPSAQGWGRLRDRRLRPLCPAAPELQARPRDPAPCAGSGGAFCPSRAPGAAGTRGWCMHRPTMLSSHGCPFPVCGVTLSSLSVTPLPFYVTCVVGLSRPP